jgi:hypothetical protein
MCQYECVVLPEVYTGVVKSEVRLETHYFVGLQDADRNLCSHPLTWMKDRQAYPVRHDVPKEVVVLKS